jgi:hypothetical protein
MAIQLRHSNKHSTTLAWYIWIILSKLLFSHLILSATLESDFPAQARESSRRFHGLCTDSLSIVRYPIMCFPELILLVWEPEMLSIVITGDSCSW